MHYKTPKVNLNLLELSAFLKEFEEYPVVEPKGSEFEANAGAAGSTEVVVLEHAR